MAISPFAVLSTDRIVSRKSTKPLGCETSMSVKRSGSGAATTVTPQMIEKRTATTANHAFIDVRRERSPVCVRVQATDQLAGQPVMAVERRHIRRRYAGFVAVASEFDVPVDLPGEDRQERGGAVGILTWRRVDGAATPSNLGRATP
jgi:hypothetical protein